ncbi:MAG: GxxExxY protein [Pirellulaceae bacterium]
MSINEITQSIIGAAIEVHRRLGPGLLESAYRVYLAYELRKREFEVQEELPNSVVSRIVSALQAFRKRWRANPLARANG